MLPEILTIETKDAINDKFYGLNQKEDCSDAEFSDMRDISSDDFPYIKTRQDRDIRVIDTPLTNFYGGIVYDEDFYSVHRLSNTYYFCKNFEIVRIDGDVIYLKNTSRQRQIVKFGAYLFVYPDNVLYNPEDNTVTYLDYKADLITEVIGGVTYSSEFYLSDKNGYPFLCDENLERLVVPAGEDTMKEVDDHVSHFISNSDIYGPQTLGLAVKTIKYADNTTQDLNYANILISRKEYVRDKAGRTSYPIYYLDLNANNDLIVSKYNRAQNAFLPAETYVTLRIPNDSFAKDIKAGDYIKVKSFKADNTEYKQENFKNKEEQFEFINKLQNGVRVENIFSSVYYTYIVFSGLSDALLKVINSISSKIKYHYYKEISSENATYIKCMAQLNTFLNWGQNNGITAKTSLTKEVPEMDYITVSANRIWGCSSEKHEIYASKQGDASSWFNYAGIASDSYAVTIANEEKFTGAITLNETPYFFKENMAYAIFGNKPKNYQVQQIKCRGVEDGAYRTLAQKDGYVYYKSTEGIERFNGSNSQSLSEKLNLETKNGTVGVIGHDKYFIVITNPDPELFVYDIKKNLWHKEGIDVNSNLFNIDGNVYNIYPYSNSNYGIKTITNIAKEKNMILDMIDVTETEGPEWFIESGEFNGGSLYNKYINKFMFELKIAPGSKLSILFSYDDSNEWEKVFKTTDKHAKRTIKVPVTPRRCERMKYRIEGSGQCKIYSILRTVEGGSETNGTSEY